MHEASIALAIVDELLERTASQPITKVTAVHVSIGALSSVVPDALQFAWDVATDGTLAAGSVLRIERISLSITCSVCACERRVPGTIPVCPVCGTSSNEIVHGLELLVTAMEVVHAPAPDRRSTEHSAQKHYAGA